MYAISICQHLPVGWHLFPNHETLHKNNKIISSVFSKVFVRENCHGVKDYWYKISKYLSLVRSSSNRFSPGPIDTEIFTRTCSKNELSKRNEQVKSLKIYKPIIKANNFKNLWLLGS